MDKRHNAIKHGLLRKKIHLMPDESRYLFRKWNNKLIDHWQPSNIAESIQVEELAFNYWRLKRAYQLETEFIQEGRTKANKFNALTVEFLSLKDFDRFTRYITSIQRQISRNLHELERLQAAKKGQIVPPPGVLDVDINLGRS
jgi:hypothetical protein